MEEKYNSKQWAYQKRAKRKINKISLSYWQVWNLTSGQIEFTTTKTNARDIKHNNRAKLKIDHTMEVKQYMKYVEEKQQTIHDLYINETNEINTRWIDYNQSITYSDYKKNKKKLKKKNTWMRSQIQNELHAIYRQSIIRPDQGLELNLSPFECELLIFGYNKFSNNNLYIPDVISNLIMHFYYLGDICNMCYNYAPNGLMQYNKDKIIFTQQHSSSIDNILISNKGLEMNKEYIFRVQIINKGFGSNGMGIIKDHELLIDYMNSEKVDKPWWRLTTFFSVYHEFTDYSDGDLVEIYIQLNSDLSSMFIIDKNGKYYQTKVFDVDDKSIYYPYVAWTNHDRYSEKLDFAKQKVSFELLY